MTRGAILSLSLAFAASSLPAQTVDTLALEAHARFLSHDLLEGRGTGSRGEALAALYLESRFQALGLEPLGEEGYRLPVPLVAVRFDDAATRLTISTGGTNRVMASRDFYHPGGGPNAFRDFEGALLDAGAAPDALEALRDHPDLTGSVVVLGPPWDGIAAVEAELHRRGAEGAIEIVPNGPLYDRLRIVRGPVRYWLREPVDDPGNQGPLPVAIGGPALAKALGLEIAPGRALDRARETGATVEVDWAFETDSLTAWNVAARLPGADPSLAGESVLWLAHYDHVGFGEPAAGDSIWNGFVDNAAGVAAVLEVARVLAADPPARSAVFLLVTAEEQGLLGSNRFVEGPPVPLESIRLAINLDAGAPVAPPTTWWISAGGLGDLETVVRDAVEWRGWSLDVEPPNDHSDHASFLRVDVPALFLVPGGTFEGVTEEEARALEERLVHPHTAGDEWSPEFSMAGLARYAELALAIGRAVAEAQ